MKHLQQKEIVIRRAEIAGITAALQFSEVVLKVT